MFVKKLPLSIKVIKTFLRSYTSDSSDISDRSDRVVVTVVTVVTEVTVVTVMTKQLCRPTKKIVTKQVL